MESKLILYLSEFGFTQNEAKTYLTLLSKNPITGYEISQRSGVPRSAIYDILKKLEINGFVSTIGEKPLQYIPISTEQLSQKLVSKFEHNLDKLNELFDQFEVKSTDDSVWNIKGYESMIDHLRLVIDNAESSIYCSIWNRELTLLLPQITKAHQRGVNVVNMSFSDLDSTIGYNYCYGIHEEKLNEVWQRQIIVIVDKFGVLLGSANQSKDNQAIWTTNHVVLNTALNNIILDITLYSQRKNVDVEEVLSGMMEENSSKLESLI